MQVAHKERNGSYLTVKDNESVLLHPSTNLSGKPDWVLCITSLCYNIQEVREDGSCNQLAVVNLGMAEHYYGLSNFPSCSAKNALQQLYMQRERMSKSKK